MKKAIIYLCIVASLCSCEKIFFNENLESVDPKTNFEYLWNQCNEKYSFFEVKNIDWDAKKEEYSALISDDMSEDELFTVLGSMLNDLRDDHTNLISPFNVSSFGVNALGQDNYDRRILEDNYFPDGFYQTGPFSHEFLNDGEIGYIRFSSFTGTVTEDNYEFMMNRYKDTKGLILDLRENGGGAASEVFSLLGRFVNERTLLNYSRQKIGPEADAFSEPEEVYLEPSVGTKYLKNVVFLCDRGTYSAGSFTSLGTKAIDSITLMGDTTGGGLGLPNGGQLPNGWTYRFSVTQALTLDTKSPEFENGVPPDVVALFDWTDLTTDEVLERALQELL